jgi:hypothetical protein
MREVREMIWERQYWKAADENPDGRLDYGEVERLCRRLGINRREGGLDVLFKVSTIYIFRFSPARDLPKRYRKSTKKIKAILHSRISNALSSSSRLVRRSTTSTLGCVLKTPVAKASLGGRSSASL